MAEHCDVLVVGAGAVGASTALGLAQQGRQVALVEAREPAAVTTDSEYDLRVFALSLATEAWLEYLGVWPGVVERRLCAYSDMRVWDADSDGRLHFDRQDVDHRHLGHIVENAVLVDALCSAARTHPNIEWLCPEKVADVAVDGGHPRVWLEGGAVYQCGLLVAADGARSDLRQRLGIEVSQRSYGQRAIVAMVATADSHQNTAWQRFLQTGPVAFLPLANGQCSIVWSADDDLAGQLLGLDDQAFCQRLFEASDGALGEILATTERVAFPLAAQHAREYVRPGVALVGDAAHVIHPLAGQGVNLGFMDAAALVDVLAAGGAPGMGQLRRYARRRRHANQVMQSGMTALYQAFGRDTGGWARLRGRGMRAVDQSATLRRMFAKQAAGLSGDVPDFLLRRLRR